MGQSGKGRGTVLHRESRTALRVGGRQVRKRASGNEEGGLNPGRSATAVPAAELEVGGRGEGQTEQPSQVTAACL